MGISKDAKKTCTGIAIYNKTLFIMMLYMNKYTRADDRTHPCLHKKEKKFLFLCTFFFLPIIEYIPEKLSL